MKLLMAACSHSYAIDARTNSASLFNIIEEISPTSFPFVIPGLVFFALFDGENEDDGDKALQLSISLNKEVIANGPFMLNFQSKSHARGIAEIGGVLIISPGVLEFTLFNGKVKLAKWSVLVRDGAIPKIEPGARDEKKVIEKPKKPSKRSGARLSTRRSGKLKATKLRPRK